MIFVHGQGRIVNGPYIDGSSDGNVTIEHGKGKEVQLLASNYLSVQGLLPLKKGDSISFEGMIDDLDEVYSSIRISKITKLEIRKRYK